MIKRAVAERLRSGVTVLREDLLFERTGIYADSDRDSALTAGVGDRLYPVVGADVAGVDADFINSRGACLESQFVIEMYVRDNGSLDRFVQSLLYLWRGR